MIKRFFIVATLFLSISGTYAQEGSPSPYSFFGIGTFQFNGTVENRSMGGIGVYSDSIHINLQNPAAYGGLKLTTYTIGGSHKSLVLKSDGGKDKTSNSTLLNYLAIGIPAGKWGFGIGLVPFTSVGYALEEKNEDLQSSYSGSGGVNRLFLAAGYQFNEHFKIGAEVNYNFGNIQNKSIFFQDFVQFGTREINRSDFSGFNFNFGAHYQTMLNENLQLTGSANFSPSSKIASENSRQLALLQLRSNGAPIATDVREVEVPESTLKIPTQFSIGAGLGKPNKWFAGLEYGRTDALKFSNRSYSISEVKFEPATSMALGGFYVPKYNDITNYFNRIVYRAGIRYQETGLNLRNQDINEFGISFGVGLPVGRMLSNLNLGFEFGQRGTTEANLVEENFYNFFISLSLNDLWFQKTKYN